MIITFCGRSSLLGGVSKEKLLNVLYKEVGNNPVDFYLGGYGAFNNFAKDVCDEYKKTNPNAKVFYVTPYLDDNYIKDRKNEGYDEIIFPDIENAPKRLCILRRNYEMVKSADLVIAYIRHSFGGAYQTYHYAEQMKKRIINLYDDYPPKL